MKKKVAVQKGKIKADMPTMKMMKKSEQNSDDKKNAKMRRSGQTMKAKLK